MFKKNWIKKEELKKGVGSKLIGAPVRKLMSCKKLYI